MDTKIQTTTDYSKFKFLDLNRDVKPTKKLLKSLGEFDITCYNPTIVTKNFKIIDGQNRFEVCKQLGNPIHYVMVEEDDFDTNKAIQLLNIAQKNWQLPDYLDKYCKLAYPNYLAYRNFMRYYRIGNGNLGVMTMVFCGKCFSSRIFKEGRLEGKWEHADKVMGLLNSMDVPYRYQKNFIEAFITIFKSHSEREIKKLLQKISGIPNLGSISGYIAAMNNAIDSRR